MRLLDITMRSVDSLANAKLRSVLTMLAIGVGAFAMTLGVALNLGGGEYANNILTANIDGHSLWVMKKQDEKSTPLYPSKYGGFSPIWFNKLTVLPMSHEDLNDIEKVRGVDKVKPAYFIDNAIIERSDGDGQKYNAVINVAREGAYRVYVAGDQVGLKDDEVILPDGFSDALDFVTPDQAIGRRVTVTVVNEDAISTKKITFTVRAVIKRSTLSLSVAPMAVLVTDTTAKQLFDFIHQGTIQEGKFIAATAKVKAGDDLEKTKQRIIARGYFAQTPDDVYSAMHQFVGVLRIILIIFGIIAVLTAVFGIINTQHISVLERVQEIGLMKAVGMSGKDVRKLFEFEATLMGLVGGSIGTALAVVTGMVTNPIISQILALDTEDQLMVFTIEGTVGVAGIVTLVALLAGILPARRASKLDPVEALRNDNL